MWLKDKVVHAATLWNPFQPDAWGFAAPRTFGLERLLVLKGEALVAATPGAVDSETRPTADRALEQALAFLEMRCD
jgi:hypothetical protein